MWIGSKRFICKQVTVGLLLFLLLCVVLLGRATAAITVVDGSQRQVVLAQPAQRIITLSPHLLESVYHAGALDKVVAVVQYSNYPPEASSIEVIGSYATVNYEKIVALNPDLVLVWQSGNGYPIAQRLTALGIATYIAAEQQFTDIAKVVKDIGRLADTTPIADAVAANYLARLKTLQQRYSGRQPIQVFYMVWPQPLQTLTRASLMARIIGLCGGVNVYANAAGVAPKVDSEAFLLIDPQAIISSQTEGMQPWQQAFATRWPQLLSSRRGYFIDLPADESRRPTIRLLNAAESLCLQLDQVRQSLAHNLE